MPEPETPGVEGRSSWRSPAPDTTGRMKERHWTSLVAAIQRHDCVLVLGPEVPIERGSASLPTQRLRTVATEVSDGLARELESEGRRNVVRESLSATAQAYADDVDFGEMQLRIAARNLYASVQGADQTTHDSLARLPIPLILSTCHDDLLERALREQGKKVQVQRYAARDRGYNPEFSISKDPQSPTIYHLFGTFKEPETLILSEDDILDWVLGLASKTSSFPNSLLSALRQPMLFFLFIGFGIKHRHLRILAKLLLRHFEFDRKKNACAAESLDSLPSDEWGGTIDFYRRGTRVEVIDQDAEGFLSELHRRLGVAAPPPLQLPHLGCRPKVFISYASEDARLARHVCDYLDRSGFEPWLDQSRLLGGERWDNAIMTSIEDSDFVIVLVTTALSEKRDSYVNKEISLAVERARKVRGGRCIVPLVEASMQHQFSSEFHELRDLQALTIDSKDEAADLKSLASILTREYQRRQRG